ncbi:RNA polymerase sigma factor RpoD/SigA [Mucilaginibacter sp. BT774]|uniref:sigma-70 family RNA polymerase sigma factor n=1 Tax=Mucilaginibacter sp. BT774 TaxID=3062276 RepID=UPI002676CF44|nr:RNA polymerase sigma factor RpoD/SigA [Mucilaginibacter sp. BT774]MDO3626227.1 RNA polymerase sigma factor RpoD/SigA [Mucilaginibacter sp. BT774]
MRQLIISKSITQRDYKSLDKYFNEIDKIELISTQEEVMLARRIREGDKAALERLTKTNLRFVVSVAKQYQHMGLTLGDLINEGNMGLIIAAKRYDETRGFKFISYAVWWIRQSISNALAEHARMVRLPYNQLILLNKLHKAQSTLEQEHGRNPSEDELAGCMELPVEKVKDMMNKSGASISIDEPFQGEDNYTLLDVLPSNEASTDFLVEQKAITREIHYSMKVLSKRDRELLVMFFGLGSFSPQSLEEIGKRFNISKEHVSRLKEKALRKLRNCSNAQVLMSCLS